jgi:hypothetical protein
MQLPFNLLKPGDPDNREVLNNFKFEIFNDLNCHMIGSIISFNATNQTAEVSLKFKRQLQTETVNYTVLKDCPVIIHKYERKPILPGDECLILFNDRNIDSWFNGGTATVPNNILLHDMGDAIVLIGLHSLPNSISNYDNTKLGFTDGNASLLINTTNEKIIISNNNQNLNTLIVSLINVIKNLYTLPVVNGSPATLDPAVISQLETIKSNFGVLFE